MLLSVRVREPVVRASQSWKGVAGRQSLPAILLVVRGGVGSVESVATRAGEVVEGQKVSFIVIFILG